MATPSPRDRRRLSNPGNHILVVDDEPLVVSAVCSLLQLRGYRTSGALSGREAQELLEASLSPDRAPIDLVVLDWAMPQISGLEVCSWIKGHPQLSHLPVLMLTAAAAANDKVTGLETGADDYVTKPYHPGELVARIHALLRSYRLERELFQRNRQLAALNQIATAITSSMRAEDILTITLHGIIEILDVESASLVLLDESGQHLIYRHVLTGGEKRALRQRLRTGQGLVGHVARTRAPLLVNEVQDHPFFDPNVDGMADLKVQSILIVPLTVKERLIGLMEAVNKRDWPFTPKDLDLFLSMAAPVAVALENAGLFADLRAAYQQVQASRKKLQATASTLQALFDGITDGLYIVDRKWKLVAVNQGQARQASAQSSALVNQVCFRALHRRDSPCPSCQVSKTLSSGTGVQWTERHRSEKGLFNEWELSTYPIFDRVGDVIQTIVLRREMTEQRRLETSLAKAERLAAVGQLAAGVAHEINNPLTAVIANAQFLTEDLSPDDDTYQSAELIARAGERAARVVRRLLDFARQEEFDWQEINVNASLREALTLLEPQLSSSEIQVATRLQAELPPITASADHIQGIWLNLLINAKDALSTKRGDRKIQVHTRQREEQIEVSIIDNGPGIPAEQLPHIFHPFYTTKAPGQGTGLGLSTSYMTAEQHGGRIDVISEPGQGTAFVVKLPLFR